MLVSSESIKAPAEVTLVTSVTSAAASMPSSLAPSTDTSRPSKVEVVITGPVNAPPALGKAALATITVAATASALTFI